ncbi:MAG: OmpP1/FadL family transporter, partial [Calditrichia bacterium]
MLHSGSFRFGFAIVVLILLFAVSSVFATNGYFSHGYGTRYKAIAGAGVALYLSPMGVATNPASAAFLGKQLDVGFSVFNPNREYTVTGNPSGFPGTFPLMPGTVESDSKIFVVPHLGVNFALPNGNHAITLAVYGNGGMNTDYPVKTFDNPSLTFDPPTGVNLSQLFANATYSREIISNHSIGISGIFVFQQFKAEGLSAFGGFSSDPSKLTNNGTDNSTGFGFRVGYLGNLSPVISIGGAFQSKMYMKKFDKYAGLFAEMGDFDVPANWTAGIAVHPGTAWTIALDVQQILYSKIKSIGNPLDLVNNSPVDQNGQPNPNFKPLGDPDGWGFGWQDIFVFKVGAQWQAAANTTVRGGYSYAEQPIPDSEVMFNILAPGVIQHHITLGLSQVLSPKVTLNIALMHALSHTVTGPNPFEAPG